MEPVLRGTFDAVGQQVVMKVRATDATGRQAAALAVLDVVEPEPLPPDHRFFALSQAEIQAELLPHLRRINPAFEPTWVTDSWSFAAPSLN